MAESTAGEIVVERASPSTPKRSTRLVRPTAKAQEAARSDGDTTTETRKRPATRSTRISSKEKHPEYAETQEDNASGNDSLQELLRGVLWELGSVTDASKKQQELITRLQENICHLQENVLETQREVKETKDELKQAREQLEAISAATTAQSSPRASYADVARTPPDSQPSNIQSLPSANTTSSNLTDTLYCTVDISRVDEAEHESVSVGAIRSLIEKAAREKLDQPSWRCRAVTVDRRNHHRIRVACRDESEHQLVKQLAETKIPSGARILRDELYPVKVDNVNRMAVLNTSNDLHPGVAETLGKENDVQVAKVAWLSKRDAHKAYGSMVVYMTKASDAKKILDEGFFCAGGESGYACVFERRPRPEQCYRCQGIGHKAFQCSKPQICGNCAQEGHHHSGCTELISKCALCSGPHEAFSRSCPRLFPSRHG